MEEERPNLRPRLNKALRRIAVLERYIEAFEAARPCDWDCSVEEYNEYKAAKAALVATADLKPEPTE